MSQPSSAPLVFVGVEFTKVAFSRALGQDGQPVEVAVTHTTTVPIEPDHSFECRIGVEVTSQATNNSMVLTIEAVGLFEMSGDFDEVRWRNYQNISAPGLVYPYVRAFISTLTVMSGLTAVTIQPIDFARAYQLKLAEKLAALPKDPELPFGPPKEAR